MSTRPDPGRVLRHLAKTLDVDETLRAFPGMTKQALSEILSSFTGPGPDGTGAAVLWVDGAARGNPGEAGAGIVLRESGGKVHRFGEYLGGATNNVAEYKALLAGIEMAARMGIRELEVRSDSELVVKQINGHYRVKNPQLQELYFNAIRLISSLDKVTFTHVPREENREADKLANMAIDAKGSVSL